MKIRPSAVIKALAVIGFLVIALNNNARRLIRQELDKRKIRAQIAELKIENDGLAAEMRLLETDDDYYSAVVRRDLGMLKPGEVEYRFSSAGRLTSVKHK